MLSSALFLVALFVCALVSVSSLPVLGKERRSPIALPAPFESFSRSEDDFTLEFDDDAEEDDTANEVPKYADYSKSEKTSSSFGGVFLGSRSVKEAAAVQQPIPVVESATTEAPANPSGDQPGQFAQLGSDEYQPDAPIFDRRILLKLKKEGLLTRNS